MVARSVVEVAGVSKRFRLYHERNQSLKASVLRGRRARFEEFWALRDLSFVVPQGSTLGLIGENGSGKSTLLKCMARILRPDAGTISSSGKVSALLELGAGFHPELSGRENVFLNGAILGLSKRQLSSRFDEIVDFAGIERFIDTPVKNYSSGMYVRLGFSVAINVDPDILLIDEVLAVGDAEFQRKCTEKIADMHAAGKTIVLVSHSLPSVRAICDQVVLLEHGKIRAMGAPGEIIDEYLSDAYADSTTILGVARAGSGEVRVESVDLIDAGGNTVDHVRTGDAVRLRFHYRAQVPIDEIIIGMALHTLSGIEVSATSTRRAGLVCAQVDGGGFVDLEIPRLLLVPGAYRLTTGVADRTNTHMYDSAQNLFRFEVEPGWPHEENGVVSLGGRWVGEQLRELVP